ncbi:MAG: class I poly(R)-hydroxyalkanoic acid synthase [Pseudomonadota bacterium]
MQKAVDDKNPETETRYQIENPEQFAQNMLRVFEESGKIMTEYMDRADTTMSPYSTATEMTEASKSVAEVVSMWMADPPRLMEAQTVLAKSYMDVWNQTLQRMMGQQTDPVIDPDPGDNRFKDPEWRSNPYFDFWKQSYLITTQWAQDMLAHTSGLDEAERRRAEYYMRLYMSAFSPSNFPMTNPEVVRETFKTNATNLVKGMELLAHDMEQSGDLLKISQTDLEAFEIGRNLAVTPGKVVFQTDVLQLIQYSPTTDTVCETPLLIIPPWINKFYILDLTPPKSFVKYAVDRGHTVFVVSWVNPDETLAGKRFEDYVHEGVLEAADAVRRETGVAEINAIGYCVGGTLLATTLAYTAAINENVFKSVTFLTTQVDFQKAGELLLFIDESQLKSLDDMMTERGYLDGSRMANVFNMMRPRDLIWPYIVNNYLLGKKPFPFDLLYWNQDSTRMPAANHRFYLREFYHENKLAKGELTITGKRLDLAKVKTPIFEVATKEDHIAPAESVFLGSQLFGGEVEFVLAGAGHIAGVINPPEKMKYLYWTSTRPNGETLQEWIANAHEHPGSWWPHWAEWVSQYSGPQIPARTPGEKLGTLEDAPGSYVKVRC